MGVMRWEGQGLWDGPWETEFGGGAVQLAGESLTCSSDSLAVFVVVVALSFVCFVF